MQNLASDPNSVGEYLIASKLDRSSSNRVSGLPIKKLLAEDMSKEIEPKKRSPSVVARLMGLDGLPTEQPIYRQRKTSKQRTTSGIAKMGRNPYECQSYMESSRESPEFKDVYEVSNAKELIKPRHSEAEMNFIQQKFMDAKRLSADAKYHNSKEFHDTLDALDTNKDLLVKFLQQPDSLYAKHLHDLQGASLLSHCSHVLSISHKCKCKTTGLKSKEGTSHCSNRYFREHCGSFSPNSYSPCSSNRSAKSYEVPVKELHESKIFPTRIVVLKPTLEKLQSAEKPVTSHRRYVEYPSNISNRAGQFGVQSLHVDVGISRPNMRESRERAKVITRRISKDLGTEPLDFPSLVQGYAGDESSYSVSGSDSGSELEESMLPSRKSFHWKKHRNATLSYLHESSICREAKKRNSKRWNVSQIYRDVGSVGQISKLSEMLAKPNREMRRGKFDRELLPDMSRDRVFVSEIMDFGSPSGISGRDDWKDKYASNVFKTGFISDSSVSCYSPKSSNQCRKRSQDRKLVLKEPVNQDRSTVNNQNVIRKKGFPFRNPRRGNQKLQLGYHSCDGADIEVKDQCDMKGGENISPEEVSLVSKMPVGNDNGPHLMTEEHECNPFSSGSTDELVLKPSPCLLGINNTSAPCSEDSQKKIELSGENYLPFQSSVPETQSPISSKEADQPSPISVLEASLAEDLSSASEGFERVSADLQELRMQLKFLRMESGGDENYLTLSNKDDRKASFLETAENTILDDGNRQTSYIGDVLKESGVDSADPNMIIALWHSLDCPVGQWVFEKLEKKYCKDKSRSKSDRRLLFDRINCGLAEVFWWLVDPYPWVKTGRKKSGHEWVKNGACYELEKLLASEENQTCKRVLDREMAWLDFGDEVDVIGRELDNLLVNDLIDEMVNMFAL